MTVRLTRNPTTVRISRLRTIDPRQTGPTEAELDRKRIDLSRIGPKRIGRHNRRLGMTVRLTPNPTTVRISRLRTIVRTQTVPSRTDRMPIDLNRIGPKRIVRHNRRLGMTVRLTPNPTIARISRLRIIVPRQTAPSRTDRMPIDLNRIGPKRIVRHNRRLGMTVQPTRNPTIVRISRLRIIVPRQTAPSRVDRKRIDLSRIGPKRIVRHIRRLGMTVQPTRNPTIVRISRLRIIDQTRIGRRRTVLRIDPRQSPLELRNVNNRSHKHLKRKSASRSSARRSHSHLSKQLA